MQLRAVEGQYGMLTDVGYGSASAKRRSGSQRRSGSRRRRLDVLISSAGFNIQGRNGRPPREPDSARNREPVPLFPTGPDRPMRCGQPAPAHRDANANSAATNANRAAANGHPGS